MIFKIKIANGSNSTSFTYYTEIKEIHNIENILLELRDIAAKKAEVLLPLSNQLNRGKLIIHVEQIL